MSFVAVHDDKDRQRPMRRQQIFTAATAGAVATLVFGAMTVARSSTQEPRGGWFPVAPTQIERAEAAAATVGGSIYVAGGFTTGGVTTNSVERYDPVADRWQLVKPMPVALNHPSAVSYRGDLYVVGGYTNVPSDPGIPTAGLADASDAFLRYDPERDRWSRLDPMPVPRSAAAAAVLGHRLYVAGGREQGVTGTPGEGLLRRLDIYDFKTGRWSRGPDMSVAREHTAGDFAWGKFYVLSGRTTPESTRAVERYLPSERRWEQVPPMRVGHAGFPAITVGGRVVAFGSEEPSDRELRLAAPETELFDPARNRWLALPDMRTPRGAVAGAALGRRVFAIGGIEGPPTIAPLFSSVVEALDVPIPGGRCGGRLPTIVGTHKRDLLRGTPFADVISGLGGRDRITALGGKDVICGRGGDDKLTGNKGRDKLLGGKKRDTLLGGKGRDTLRGGPGSDRLFGGKNNDRLNGGSGRDRCGGGAGRDRAKRCEKSE